jgi:hypothetical protein
MGDNYAIENSSRSQLVDEPFQNKVYNYVQDLNKELLQLKDKRYILSSKILYIVPLP